MWQETKTTVRYNTSCFHSAFGLDITFANQEEGSKFVNGNPKAAGAERKS